MQTEKEPKAACSSIVKKIESFIAQSILPVAERYHQDPDQLPHYVDFVVTEQDTLRNMVHIAKCECPALLHNREHFIKRSMVAFDMFVALPLPLLAGQNSSGNTQSVFTPERASEESSSERASEERASEERASEERASEERASEERTYEERSKTEHRPVKKRASKIRQVGRRRAVESAQGVRLTPI